MAEVKVGIIGIGNMGSSHARNIYQGKVKGAKLTAVCDLDEQRLQWAKTDLGEEIACYSTPAEFYAEAEIEAVIIATPHYDHPPLAVEGFKRNLHVLIEKPAGVYTKAVREMNEAAAESDKVFAIMYNQRTRAIYQKLKDLIDSGELGEIKRTNWIIDWYRSQSYYNNGGWRATWEGEGGGVLLNQDPHQLDIWQWTCGMPVKVRAFAENGKYHNIEVEDDVTAYVEYENGATGVFVTSTGIAPETNRLEITGNKGKLILEDNKITFRRLRTPEREFNKNFEGGFGSPECWECKIPVADKNPEHLGILNNWLDAILNGAELIAPGKEGIKGLTISNAMHLSAWTDDWVELPLDENLFKAKLDEKIKNSTFVKESSQTSTMDVEGTF
ncbi:putative dehydrogenase [Halanaerobium saccharolyticum]|jgi:predicted dehydrogenase|uniref:Putative dehydrogenase n=1 Tax=Halanaerobium saccharolyticum TaxID=43595 RepID=A0A4R7YRT4_9FIRM|nr:Gfo/Idh/MocA family oxidoreductase [Halanaerobium saccharolyticum]RAK05463.1 putative dehydrogenase [Halanaerobium saccharolyticum]TDV99798.1 putative dehydrogenase [Halanaerobium saccharolyticum]TDX52020.1 putative dehydrogenase [Halanaerobium saccharolyticum]